MKRSFRPAFTGLSSFFLALVTLVAFFWSPAALAWPKDVHRSIAQAALVLAPEAALRIPLDQRATFLKEASEPDYVDKDCRFHCAATGALDPAMQASAIFRQLSD
ncbi:MAG TPA: hypothetical protein VGR00_08020, partial [Thermoanaerobaculia bacterium]|nr:hypothetical protein [Thermoanaerobaculia bacterium]